MSTDRSGGRGVAAVILAAGGSIRLGRPKPLVDFQGLTLVSRAAGSAIAAGCDPVIVVVGSEAERVRLELAGQPVRIACNSRWSEGLASSIRTGVEAVSESSEARAVLLLVCDQPRISAEVVRRLCDRFEGGAESMVACEYSGTLGVPALFGRGRFGDLCRLRGDCGAKRLLLAHEHEVLRVSWPDGAFDIDRPEDLPGPEAGPA